VRTALHLFLSLAIAAALIALLLEWADIRPAEIADTLRRIDSRAYWTALAVQAAIYPLRALRLSILLPAAHRPTVGRLLPITASHILAANVLPAKVGEASLVLYLKRVADVPAAHGLALLLVSRLLDLATLTGGLALACLGLAATGDVGELTWLAPLGSALVLVTLVLAWLVARGERLVSLARGILALLRLEHTALGRRVEAILARVIEALGEVSGKRRLLGALATLPIWICVFLFYATLARGLGLEQFSFPMTVFGSGLAILGSLLPLNGFAGFGVQDLGWAAGFTLLGASAELAASTGVAAHLIYLLHIAAFGLCGHLVMGFLARKTKEEQRA